MAPGLAGFIADSSDPQTWDDITLAVLAANFAVDVMYVWLDPRTRADG